jgi:lactose/L-arabinose transport system substrate-binding protein
MNKHLKKSTLFLSFLLLMSAAACGGGAANPAATASSAPPATEAAPAGTAAEPAASGSETESLAVWCWDPAFNLYAMTEAGKVYKQDHPNFKLDVVEVPWDDIQNRINTAEGAGDLSSLPDIMLCQNNAYQKNAISYPDLFVDLTGSGIAFDKFGASAVAYSVIDGKNYGVPFDNGAAVNGLRVDILEQAGYAMEDFTDITWDEYIEAGEAVLEKTGKPLLSGTAGSIDLITMMLQSAGASLFNADGSPNVVDNGVLRKAIDVYLRLVASGVMVEVNNWDEYITTFINGTVAGTINGCWILASVQTAADQSGKWAITNVPKLSDVEGATNYTANGGSSWGVSSNSGNPELAKDFLSSTFAGSVPLYETILPASGALANYLPAGESTVYSQPQEFFGGQPIYSDIVKFSSLVPSNMTGVYYYEARAAVGTAVTNIIAGSDIGAALQAAQDEINFTMGN